MKNFIVDFRGASCAGKSTLIKNFLETKKGIMHISTDKMKWFFNDYLDNKKKYRPILGKMLIPMIDESLQNGVPVIFEGSERVNHQDLAKIAQKHNVKLYRVNVEADYDILVERFHERIANVKAEGRVIGNMKVEGMKSRYDDYINDKKPGLDLNSGKLTEQEMVEKLVEFIE